MTTEEQLKEISRRVEKIEDRLDEQTERMFKNREELKDIIREAVSEANDKLLGKINNHENICNFIKLVSIRNISKSTNYNRCGK